MELTTSEKLFLFLPLVLACSNSEDFPQGENLEMKVKVNLLNYTDQEILPGSKVYVGAFNDNIFTTVDQITIDQCIPPKNSFGCSQTYYPDSLENWEFDLERVKNISVNGAILVVLADEKSEILVQEFSIGETDVGIPIELKMNVSPEFGYFYELIVDISPEKVKLRKHSPIVIL